MLGQKATNTIITAQITARFGHARTYAFNTVREGTVSECGPSQTIGVADHCVQLDARVPASAIFEQSLVCDLVMFGPGYIRLRVMHGSLLGQQRSSIEFFHSSECQ